jgi:hypothetical protein
MRRSFVSRAVGSLGLLIGTLAPAMAQTAARPVVLPVGTSTASPPLTMPAAPAVAGNPILLPPRAPAVAGTPIGVPTVTPVAAQTAEPQFAAPKLGGIIPVSYAPVVQPQASTPAPTDTKLSSITLSETVERTEILNPTAPGAPATSANLPAAPVYTALPPSGMPAAFPRAEPGLKRKSFVDLSAAPCFGHAPDYNWILGRVEYSSVTKEWRIRYASVDETDRYGGHVSLIENHHVAALREDMYVQVRGHLVNPENTSNGSTYFRIESFQTVEHPNSEQPGQEPSNNVAFGRMQ